MCILIIIRWSNDGYFITRIPYDRGYQILVDHQEVKSEVVNEAFLGCKIKKGKHQIQIKFTPYGYRLGFILSYFGFMVVFIHYLIERKKKMKENTKEIISYVFVGIMTTLVNYIVYFVFN